MKKILIYGVFTLLILLSIGIVFSVSYIKTDNTSIEYKTISRKLSNAEYMDGKKKNIYKLNAEPKYGIYFVRYDEISITKVKKGWLHYEKHIDTISSKVIEMKCN